jgi:hypothetical protein
MILTAEEDAGDDPGMVNGKALYQFHFDLSFMLSSFDMSLA